jgi:hypothetical protein
MHFLQNRYAQLVILTLGIGSLFWAILWIVLTLVGMSDFPLIFQLLAAFLGAGVVVGKVFSNRVF